MEELEAEAAYFRLSLESKHATSTVANLRSMQQAGELCDVTLRTECGNSVPVHKAVLAAASPYFRAMFASDLLEGKKDCIILKEIDFDILQLIIAHAYSDEGIVSSDQVAALLFTADLFQMQDIVDACCKFLAAQLKPSNCLGFAALADLHHCKWFHNTCTEYALKHYEEVICTKEFLSLPCDQLQQLISRDEIRVPSEETIYNSVLLWVYHDLDARKDSIASVMGYVRLPFVSTEFLSNNVEQEDLLLSEELCKDYIQEAVTYKLSPEKRPILRNSPRTRPRKASGMQDSILTIGGMSRNGPLSTIEQYSTNTDTWSTFAELDSPRYGVSVCVLDSCLYIIGGSCRELTDSVLCYNLAKGEWKPVTPMHSPRRYHQCEVLYGLIYAAGGQTSEGVISSVERYDPATDNWIFVQPMIESRMYHGIAEMDGLLFAVGGHSGHIRLASAECYNPSENQWRAITSLSMARSVPGVQRLGGLIYVAGGFDGKAYLNSVECYDTELNKWLLCPSLKIGRSALGLVSYNGYLYACGGFNGSFLGLVEKLSPDAEEWETCVSMTVSRAHFGITCT